MNAVSDLYLGLQVSGLMNRSYSKALIKSTRPRFPSIKIWLWANILIYSTLPVSKAASKQRYPFSGFPPFSGGVVSSFSPLLRIHFSTLSTDSEIIWLLFQCSIVIRLYLPEKGTLLSLVLWSIVEENYSVIVNEIQLNKTGQPTIRSHTILSRLINCGKITIGHNRIG